MANLPRARSALSTLLLGACALQPDYRPPALDVPGAWTNDRGGSAETLGTATPVTPRWWSQLHDPAVDHLVAAALRDNPTLSEAAARIDQARALVAVRDAGRVPAIGIDGSATRARDRFDPSGGPSYQTSAALGPRLSWELDLWRRVREGTIAARRRVAARTADAYGVRLSIVADVADTVIALRACVLVRGVRDRDIASREVELTISRARFALGNIAPVVLAAARSNLASARTERAAQEETCLRLVDALVALTGVEATTIRSLVAVSLPRAALAGAGEATADPWLPVPPPHRLALPAIVLLRNPSVVSAENEVAARWSEVAIARAERLPRIDLAAVLTGQWIRAFGSDTTFVSNSLGATVTAPLLDGGAGAGNVRRAQAAYGEAVAQRATAIRTVVREVEDALAARQSAALRVETSREMLESARFALEANAARWRAGAISQLEFEDSRRTFNRAEQGAIDANADRARAWVALVRRTGPAADPGPMPTPEIESTSR
ncbi:efflux transporter, outer membrane factor (OMF) lipoprotein, NodT family [Sphingomonas sp. NFR04]|uniref:efflux transporter outer membrane subunit n=1 Tax=Sphingomonas sp. NFR04 TaxID=1566283 RepID=UPI0008E39240|nr:efflux transporter outer membrane subunit [Sphingomonas sp. NFR04]SFJ46329.1 efflux transporter, outer membrane factor (OMF) lipoprotein, NodT family [Sphingomonas sp. NFR04]